MNSLFKLLMVLVIVCSGYQHEAFAQENSIQARLGEPPIYKIIVSKERFDEAKKADIHFKSMDFVLGDLQVTSQLSAVEIAGNLKSDTEKKTSSQGRRVT